MSPDHLGIYDKSRGDIVYLSVNGQNIVPGRILTQKNKTGIRRKVQLWNANATDSTVILMIVSLTLPHARMTYQRALKPLRRVSIKSILGQILKMPAQRAQALRAHWVALISL